MPRRRSSPRRASTPAGSSGRWSARWVLVRVSDTKYLAWNMAGALLLALVLLFARNETVIYAAVGLLGFGMACVFATFYAVATKAVPEQANEVAGLMILAISAGAVSGPVCGAVIRAAGNPHGDALRGGVPGLHAVGGAPVAAKMNKKETNMRKIRTDTYAGGRRLGALGATPRTMVEWGVIGGYQCPPTIRRTWMPRTSATNWAGRPASSRW